MRRTLDIDLSPEEYFTPAMMLQAVARKAGLQSGDVKHVEVLRRSLDSRRGIRYHTTVEVYCNEDYTPRDYRGHYQDCHTKEAVIIVGAGPAGLFAALRALEVGLKPIVIERGQPVEQRRLDIAQLGRTRQVNPESNWCFGEGGAGTYSDGKLYTRSTKRGNIDYVLQRFIEHGADPAIAIDAHAHIGTDKLSGIIANMRRTIEDHGGEYHFSTCVSDLIVEREGAQLIVKGVRDTAGNTYSGNAVILATGHSARDIYRLFADKGWMLEAKPFALGVRVEHPQSLINEIQYHRSPAMRFLPPAAYSLTTQVEGHGVFSFCMCPGGVIVPAATAEGQQVVNGMSNSKRNSPYANSGIAVTVGCTPICQRGSTGVAPFPAGGGASRLSSSRQHDFGPHPTAHRLLSKPPEPEQQQEQLPRSHGGLPDTPVAAAFRGPLSTAGTTAVRPQDARILHCAGECAGSGKPYLVAGTHPAR